MAVNEPLLNCYKTHNKNDGQVSYVYDCGPIYILIFFNKD